MPGAAYRSISNPRQYEKLRAKGFSKESAAKITNASSGRVTKSAFGIERGEISKAAPRAIGGVVHDVGHGLGESARYAGKAGRRARNIRAAGGPTRRGEFGRGLQGGLIGSRLVRHARLGTRAEGRRVSRAIGRETLGQYRTARDLAAGTAHPRAFYAGERTGRGLEFAGAHPRGVGTAVVIGGSTGAGVGLMAADRRRARRNVRSGNVGKALSPLARQALVGGGFFLGTGAAVGAASKEIDRRIGNRMGANVSFRQNYRHPFRASAQRQAAEHRRAAAGYEKYSAKQSHKATQARDPVKAEYHRLRAERGAGYANQMHHAATAANHRAVHGRRSARTNVGRYDKTRTYQSPEAIGKSAFGIDHGQAIAKAGPPRQSRRRQATRGVEVGGSVAAGTVGSAFGAAKLRDSYKQEHPEAFTRGVNRAHWFALKRGVKPARAFKLNRIATSGKPGFVPLATAVTAGSIATGARRYGQLQDRKARKSQVAKSFPRSGYIPRIGKVRVLEYHDTGHFTVLDNRDFKHRVHRDQIKFHKEKAVSKSAFGVDHGGIGKGIAGDFSMGRKMAAGLSSASQVTTPAAKLGGAVQRGVSATANAVADKGVPGAAKSGTLKAIKPLPVKTALAGGAGGAVGAAVAGRKDDQDKVPVAKSAFGIDHGIAKGLNPLRGVKNAAGLRGFVAAGEAAPQVKAIKAAAQEADLGQKLGRFQFRDPAARPPTSHRAPPTGRGRKLAVGAAVAGGSAAVAGGGYAAGQPKKKPVAKSAFGVALS